MSSLRVLNTVKLTCGAQPPQQVIAVPATRHTQYTHAWQSCSSASVGERCLTNQKSLIIQADGMQLSVSCAPLRRASLVRLRLCLCISVLRSVPVRNVR